jgi:hypothetical protein
MKCACEHEVVIDAELIQSIGKVSLIDEPASLIDDDQCEDNPFAIAVSIQWHFGSFIAYIFT